MIYIMTIALIPFSTLELSIEREINNDKRVESAQNN
jgi:hypothetical protein